jgi:hypothetical protein
MNKRLAAISARLAECKKNMTTFRDPWQAVVDVEYLLRRIRRLEKPLRRWTVDQQRKDGSWHRTATAHIWPALSLGVNVSRLTFYGGPLLC